MMKNLMKGLNYYRINVRFLAEKQVRMKFWIGAVLRNRFLFAADNVVDANGRSLRNIIDTITLPESHFLYKQLQGGFPKGFFLDCSSLPRNASGFTIESNRVYSFSLILVGNHINYKRLYVEALKKTLEDGFGAPIEPIHVIDVSDAEEICMQDLVLGVDRVALELQLNTPVELTQKTSEVGNGYKNKLNNFPSFYQLLRSVAYRLLTLRLLYTDDVDAFESKDKMDGFIDVYIAQAVEAVLLNANIRHERCYAPPKQGHDNLYTMRGYIGRLCFANVPSRYFPLLWFASGVGVGNNVNYGLGNFSVCLLPEGFDDNW